MKVRDVIIGFVFLVILIAGALWIFRVKNTKTSTIPLATPTISQRISDAFPNLKIPDGVERANLNDVNGGSSIGVATRTEVVANLPTLDNGKSYQVLLENNSGKTVILGDMKISKSGYIIEYNSASFQGFNKIIVTQENTHVLEGSF